MKIEWLKCLFTRKDNMRRWKAEDEYLMKINKKAEL